MKPEDNPLQSLDQWDDDLLRRYPKQPVANQGNTSEEFRSYDDAPDHVREFYRLNHQRQTVEINRLKREQFLPLNRRQMGIWEAMEFLNTLIDDSDRIPISVKLSICYKRLRQFELMGTLVGLSLPDSSMISVKFFASLMSLNGV